MTATLVTTSDRTRMAFRSWVAFCLTVGIVAGVIGWLAVSIFVSAAQGVESGAQFFGYLLFWFAVAWWTAIFPIIGGLIAGAITIPFWRTLASRPPLQRSLLFGALFAGVAMVEALLVATATVMSSLPLLGVMGGYTVQALVNGVIQTCVAGVAAFLVAFCAHQIAVSSARRWIAATAA